MTKFILFWAKGKFLDKGFFFFFGSDFLYTSQNQAIIELEKHPLINNAPRREATQVQ